MNSSGYVVCYMLGNAFLAAGNKAKNHSFENSLKEAGSSSQGRFQRRHVS